MGFLDQKERIMDTIITQEGRSQLARFGKMNPVFYSFSDMGVVYDVSTIVTGSQINGYEIDETYRPMLESTSLDQDTITFEKDDASFLTKKILQTVEGDAGEMWTFRMQRGEILAKDSTTGEEATLAELIRENRLGDHLGKYSTISSVNDYLQDTTFTTSFQSFKNQQILRSPDPLSNIERTFRISPQSMNFQFSDTLPIENSSSQEADINHVEPLFLDRRLSHEPSFQYLPPVYETQIGDTTLTPEANYPDLSQSPILKWTDLQNDLSKLAFKGMMQEVIFAETSIENNLYSQFFEYNNGVAGKLDIIDFGLFKDNDVIRHVFFAGKLFKDGYSQPTFVNMFTLVFELAES